MVREGAADWFGGWFYWQGKNEERDIGEGEKDQVMDFYFFPVPLKNLQSLFLNFDGFLQK